MAFGLAVILGCLAVRLKVPPLVSDLFASVLIEPATPCLVADIDIAGQLAEIGAMLLNSAVGCTSR